MSAPRFVSLDVFRGMTVCFMIIVNSPGSWSEVYPFLLHAPWHGFTVTDLVFPSFLFAVGNALAFTLTPHQNAEAFWQKTVKRSILIFLIGVLLNAFPFFDFSGGNFIAFDTLRIMGVLQRIALCYLFASVIIFYGSKVSVWVVSGLLLIAYWILLYRLGGTADPYSMTGYAGNAPDFLIFGKNHLYQGEGVPFDPEGLLSTIPAIVNVLGGYLAGAYIRKNEISADRIKKLAVVGGICILAGLLWHPAFPINKKIWTSSFVLLTLGLDVLLLAGLIVIIELKKIRHWGYFFIVFGRNPLSIYILSNVLLIILYTIPVGTGSLQMWLYESFTLIMSAQNASILFALLFMLWCWLIGYWMDRKKIYLRV